MQTDATTTNGGTSALAPEPATDVAVFGTRPSTGRPHSMSLSGATRGAAPPGDAWSPEFLLGVGVGAAAMYYLDPDSGARRRSALARARGGEWTPASRLVAGVIGTALTLLAGRRRDALGAVAGVVASVLLARRVTKPGGSDAAAPSGLQP